MSQLNVERIRNYQSPTNPGIDITSAGNVSMDSGTFLLDAANNRFGLNTASPGASLDIGGDRGVRFNTTPLREKFNTVSGTINGNVTCDLLTANVYYFDTASTANWTLNLRGSASVSFNALIEVGHSVVFTAISTNGGSSGFSSSLQIDGNGQTVRWSGGTAPTARGGTGGFDIYQYTILKTAASTYVVVAAVVYVA